MGKVKFGLSNFEYGVLNEQNKVATTKKLPGMKSAKLELTNELLTIAADDGPYVVISAGITDAKLEIETLD
ncbi:major tail protein, partial [Streptococcus suis]